MTDTRTDTKNKVIRRIIELCRERQLSQYKLAQISDIPNTTLNNMISQNKMPTITSLERLCKGLDITLAEFFSSEKLYPDVTEEQHELLQLWETLEPNEKKLVKAYIRMLEECREAARDKAQGECDHA